MTDKQINLHIGSLDDMGRRFIEAWHKTDGDNSHLQEHLTFLSLEAFMAAMSPKRLELMRHLRHNGPMSIRRLSQELARNYKSVHSETVMLVNAGLIDRRAKDEVAVAWDRAITELDLAA